MCIWERPGCGLSNQVNVKHMPLQKDYTERVFHGLGQLCSGSIICLLMVPCRAPGLPLFRQERKQQSEKRSGEAVGGGEPFRGDRTHPAGGLTARERGGPALPRCTACTLTASSPCTKGRAPRETLSGMLRGGMQGQSHGMRAAGGGGRGAAPGMDDPIRSRSTRELKPPSLRLGL